MTLQSAAKIRCQGINQVAIVVKNLEEVAENYWQILGIGPWAIYEWMPPLVYDRKYHGQPSWAKERIALTQVGGVQLELVQPVEGDSVYQDWLDEHGEGLHHLNFLVDDVSQTARTLAGQGFPSLQSGRFGPPEQNNAFNYIDIKPLRTIWEPVHIGEELGAEPKMFPEPGHPSAAPFTCQGINQVAIVVKNLEEVALNYWQIMGIGPWAIFEWMPPLVFDRKYKGQPSWAKERIALTQVGNVQLELVQPVEGDSVYQDWLDEHGEGLHHLNFLVDDVDQAAQKLAGLGFPSLQSGRFGPPEQNNAFNYIDIKPLRTIWEPVHIGEELGAEPKMFPA